MFLSDRSDQIQMSGVYRRARDVIKVFTDPKYLSIQKAQCSGDQRYKELSVLEEVDIIYYLLYVLAGQRAKTFMTWYREDFSRSVYAKILRKALLTTVLLLAIFFILSRLHDRISCATCNQCLAETTDGKLCNVIEVDERPVVCTHQGTVFDPKLLAGSETGQRLVVIGRDKWGRSVRQDFPATGETAKCLRYSLCAYWFCHPVADDTFPVCECVENPTPMESQRKFAWRKKSRVLEEEGQE